MPRRRVNGEGTIYRRKDGRYEGAAFLPATSGIRKRVRVYGQTREEAQKKLLTLKSQASQGIAVAGATARLGDYLDYWLEDVVQTTRRPKTYELYEGTVRLNLKPALGACRLQQLTVSTVQRYLNQELATGRSVRKVEVIKTVLSAALTQAQREELVMRNVARLTQLPHWERKAVNPWSAAEAVAFLEVVREDAMYPAYMLLLFYGMRIGEVLGLRWQDIDFVNDVLCVRQQLQRVGGELRQGPVKTSAGKRTLPLVTAVRKALEVHRLELSRRPMSYDRTGIDSQGYELVLTTSSGTPIDPRNFSRSFHHICEQHGLRRIKVHHLRHTAATLLKALGVPARDAQLLLGHARISTTQELYQHDSLDSRREALEQVEKLLAHDASGGDSGYKRVRGRMDCRQYVPSTLQKRQLIVGYNSGGAWGIRTPAFLRAMQADAGICDRITGVKEEVRTSTRSWALGMVAVTIAVKIDHEVTEVF